MIQEELSFSTYLVNYLFDLILERLDIFERVYNDLVDGMVHGLDLDVNK